MNSQGGAGSVSIGSSNSTTGVTVFQFNATNENDFNTRLLFFCGGTLTNGDGDDDNAPALSLGLSVTGTGVNSSFGTGTVNGRRV